MKTGGASDRTANRPMSGDTLHLLSRGPLVDPPSVRVGIQADKGGEGMRPTLYAASSFI